MTLYRQNLTSIPPCKLWEWRELDGVEETNGGEIQLKGASLSCFVLYAHMFLVKKEKKFNLWSRFLVVKSRSITQLLTSPQRQNEQFFAIFEQEITLLQEKKRLVHREALGKQSDSTCYHFLHGITLTLQSNNTPNPSIEGWQLWSWSNWSWKGNSNSLIFLPLEMSM